MSLPIIAANILHDVNQRQTTVKTAVYSASYANKKHLMSVVCECLKRACVLNEVLELCKLQCSDKRLKKNKELALVVLHQHLFGKGLNGCYAKFKKVIDSQKSSIHSAVVRVKLRHKVKCLNEVVDSNECGPVLPRYMRVNTIVSSVPQVVSKLESLGYSCVEHSGRKVNAPQCWYSVDPDIGYLLALPPSTDLHNNSLVTKGSVFLQDKASCLPAFVLNPPPASHVIDACAAPGNKTTHLAALMNNTGSITAFEMSKKRCKILSSMISKAKVTCCQVNNADFTQCDVSGYSHVEYILVDPSCSGSGIAARMGSLNNQRELYSEERLRKLSSFQSVILKKALSFPSVKRVVYSTCSVHSQENEQVVQDVLNQVDGRFTLEHVLPKWTHRGETLDGHFPLGANCIRASPDTTNTIGFFIALFTRTD